MHIRLTVKLASVVEGIDLSDYAEGDVIELPQRDAQILITGGWAQPVGEEERVSSTPAWRSSTAAERSS